MFVFVKGEGVAAGGATTTFLELVVVGFFLFRPG